MANTKPTVIAVLQFCEAYRPHTPRVSSEYIQVYSQKLDARLAQICFIRQEAGILHNTYEWGDTLYSFVKSGDVDSLTEFYYQERNWVPGMPTDDPLRDGKINAVSLISVIANFVARDKLVESELGYTIADACIQLVEESKTLREVQHNAFAGIYKYTLLVQEYRQRTYHPLIQKIKSYINRHLHEEITIRDIAQSLDASPEHLSRVFRKAEGKGLKEYINDQRITQIKRQLQFSDLSIHEISRYLGFSSQSHMTEVFRKNTGVTPYQYRMEYQSK